MRKLANVNLNRQMLFQAHGKQLMQLPLLFGTVLLGGGLFCWIALHASKVSDALAVESPSFNQPETLKGLLVLSLADLERCDIARMNLLCTEGLPGAENVNMNNDLAVLDSWAQHIKSEIDRNLHHYWEDPTSFYYSTNFFKMAMMARVLYEDYDIRYNPKWIESPGSESPKDHFFADSNDVLLHGLIGDRHLGTCSSMPVLYIALGRRLGYPLKLVTTKQHLFVRWDSPTEKFDMDATSRGVSHYDDSVYRQWPFPISDEEIKEQGYLKSLSAQEELSVFMTIRGLCQTENGLLSDSAESFKNAYQLQPNWKGNQILFAQSQQTQNLIRAP
jgi:hypothetical protein